MKKLIFIILISCIHPAFSTLLDVSYVQNFFRHQCNDSNLSFTGTNLENIASLSYTLELLDYLNGYSTTYSNNISIDRIMSLEYLNVLSNNLFGSAQCCVPPWQHLGVDKSTLHSNTSKNFTWSLEKYIPTEASMYSIVFAEGKFVAVGYPHYVSYSTDGINWTTKNMPTSGGWYYVTYGNGRFVATTTWNQSYSAWSEDGENWNLSYLPTSANWRQIAYGNGKFITISESPLTMAQSTDGTDWTLVELDSTLNYPWFAIEYGNGTFVMTPYGGEYAAYSSDGINWQLASLPAYSIWNNLTYGDDKFIAVTNDSDLVAYSYNGINWHTSHMPQAAKWEYVAYGDGVFVALAYESTVSAYSYDGINWFSTSSNSPRKWQSAAYGNGKFIAVGDNYDGYIAISTGATTLWAVGTECNANATTVDTMCSNVFVGGTAGCTEKTCFCGRTHIHRNNELIVQTIPPIIARDGFPDDTTCNLQCANICADNAINDTDGKQKQILCGQ